MDLDPRMIVAGAVVGFVIGLTGMGGGALMTPVLVILFGVNPATAVSSDVIASLIMKPFGGGIHIRRGTVNWRLVQWLCIGSVPMAFLGSFLIDRVFGGPDSAQMIKNILGWVLLVAAAAIVAKTVIVNRRGNFATGEPMGGAAVRPVPTLLIGAVGGLIVGLTSVGSGSLIIVMLMLLYPALSSKEMIGSDLVQAIPLVGAAAVGHALFGTPEVEVIGAVLIGAIPAIMIGAHFSSRGSDRYIKPALFSVLLISSLKLLEPSKGAFNGLVLGIAILTAIGLIGIAVVDRRRRLAFEAEHADDAVVTTAAVITARVGEDGDASVAAAVAVQLVPAPGTTTNGSGPATAGPVDAESVEAVPAVVAESAVDESSVAESAAADQPVLP